MAKFLLVNPGESVANKHKLVAGCLDYPLTLHGVSQATNLARELQKSNNVHIIISSPLKRALETARIIRIGAFEHLHWFDIASYKHSLKVVDDLREVDYGFNWGQAIKPEYSCALEQSFSGNPSKGESVDKIYERAERVHQGLEKYTKEEKNIVLVSHSTFLCALLAYNGNVPKENFLEFRKSFPKIKSADFREFEYYPKEKIFN